MKKQLEGELNEGNKELYIYLNQLIELNENVSIIIVVPEMDEICKLQLENKQNSSNFDSAPLSSYMIYVPPSTGPCRRKLSALGSTGRAFTLAESGPTQITISNGSASQGSTSFTENTLSNFDVACTRNYQPKCLASSISLASFCEMTLQLLTHYQRGLISNAEIQNSKQHYFNIQKIRQNLEQLINVRPSKWIVELVTNIRDKEKRSQIVRLLPIQILTNGLDSIRINSKNRVVMGINNFSNPNKQINQAGVPKALSFNVKQPIEKTNSNPLSAKSTLQKEIAKKYLDSKLFENHKVAQQVNNTIRSNAKLAFGEECKVSDNVNDANSLKLNEITTRIANYFSTDSSESKSNSTETSSFGSCQSAHIPTREVSEILYENHKQKSLAAPIIEANRSHSTGSQKVEISNLMRTFSPQIDRSSRLSPCPSIGPDTLYSRELSPPAINLASLKTNSESPTSFHRKSPAQKEVRTRKVGIPSPTIGVKEYTFEDECKNIHNLNQQYPGFPVPASFRPVSAFSILPDSPYSLLEPPPPPVPSRASPPKPAEEFKSITVKVYAAYQTGLENANHFIEIRMSSEIRARDVKNHLIQETNKEAHLKNPSAPLYTESDVLTNFCLVVVKGHRERVLRDDFYPINLQPPWNIGTLFVRKKKDILAALDGYQQIFP